MAKKRIDDRLRQDIITRKSKKPISLWEGLKVDISKRPVFEAHILALCRKYQHLSDVCEDIWNDQTFNNYETIILLMSIGRLQMQAETNKKFQDIFKNLSFDKILGGIGDI